MTNKEKFMQIFPCVKQDEKWSNLLWWIKKNGKKELLGDIYDSYFWEEEYQEIDIDK